MPKPRTIELSGPDLNMYKFMTWPVNRSETDLVWVIKGVNIKLETEGQTYDDAIDKAFIQLNQQLSNGKFAG